MKSQTAAIILAAGGSTRYGSPKQLALWGKQTFIERVTDMALNSWARPVVVVLGAALKPCQDALGDKPVQIVVNRRWAAGQSTSVQAGLAALPTQITGAVFLLVDQPGVTSEVINALIERHSQTLAPVIWPEFEGRRGNPVLFDRCLFAELMQLSGDTGGRPVLLAHQNQAERVQVSNAAILLDIDRPEGL
jgi:molybdenum cofactor cytidylyltransferase